MLPSGLATVTSLVPVGALPAIEMFAVSRVGLTNVVELTVMPVAVNDALAPDSKLVPLTVTLKLVAPWSPAPGFVEVTDGDPLIANRPVAVATPPSRLVTVTSLVPGVAPEAIEMFAVSWVPLTTVVELTVIAGLANAATAPTAKPVPLMLTFWLLTPLTSALGFAEATAGPASTVNAPGATPTPLSPLTTLTSWEPTGALAATDTVAMSRVELT